MDFFNNSADDKLQKYNELTSTSELEGGVDYITNSSDTDEKPVDFASTIPPHIAKFKSLFKPMYTNTKKLDVLEDFDLNTQQALLPEKKEDFVFKRSGQFLNLKGGAQKIAKEIDSLKIPDDDKYFLKVLAERESTFNPNASITSKGKTYRGLYQFGNGALSAIGMSGKDYDGNTMNQHLAALKFGESNIKGLESNIGKKINGVTITKAGMMAAAHLGGRGGLLALLEGKQRRDELGTSTLDYLRMFEH